MFNALIYNVLKFKKRSYATAFFNSTTIFFYSYSHEGCQMGRTSLIFETVIWSLSSAEAPCELMVHRTADKLWGVLAQGPED